MLKKLRELILGKPKNPQDPAVFRNISLIAFFAWVGLGADGLSSSSYGPEEAFHALTHVEIGGAVYSFAHLAIPLAILIAVTVFLLSATYSQIIELFPAGGGGYLVASKLIGPVTGVVSGSALLVDYVLTVAISIAAGMDAIFSFLPPEMLPWKLYATVFSLVVLTILNLRGVKESIIILTPIFITFIVTHVVIILYGIFSHGADLPHLVTDTITETRSGIESIGGFAMTKVFITAFCLGGGTFTGIEAVSNGLQVLREPRVETGKKTMRYMAFSLAFTAGGILINYILNNIHAVPGQTMNASLIQTLSSNWPLGKLFFYVAMISEGALLFVAAQAGFLAGPRVMSNMAIDRWLPGRFTNLSDRLVIKDGIIVMSLAALLILLYTQGSVKILVVMYSINVFLTFTISQFGVARHHLKQRGPGWGKKLSVMLLGLGLTLTILIATILLKFGQGGWITIVITGLLIAGCFWVKRHYNDTKKALVHLDKILTQFPLPEDTPEVKKLPNKPTAILMVNGYNGMGIHSFLAIHRFFPGHFKNFVFLSVGVIDADRLRGKEEIDNLRQNIDNDLKKYVKMTKKMGIYAESKMLMETDVIEGLETLCNETAKDWSRKVFFTGQLTFEGETLGTRLLHNQTAFSLQRRLIFNGYEVVILPIRVRLNQEHVKS